jgi:hypothetical protein
MASMFGPRTHHGPDQVQSEPGLRRFILEDSNRLGRINFTSDSNSGPAAPGDGFEDDDETRVINASAYFRDHRLLDRPAYIFCHSAA